MNLPETLMATQIFTIVADQTRSFTNAVKEQVDRGSEEIDLEEQGRSEDTAEDEEPAIYTKLGT